ncbi:MAG: hypothetical protein LBS03_06795 [Bacteroidales bacterium]|jgi:hypothetical protein|nr:hypothetical protein [Bacteroidales bacterium]
MNKVVKFSMISCLAASLFACGDEKKTEEAPYFGVEAKFLTQSFGATAETKYVTVKTNQTFTATSSDSWCTATVLNEETENLKISVEAWNVVTPRTATVTVACNGFDNAVITVNQSGVGATLVVTPAQPDPIAGNGGDVTFTVTANAAWDYSIPQSGNWLTEKGKTATTLTLTAAASSLTAQQNVVVRFFLPDYTSVSEEITVSQEALFQPRLNVSSSGTPSVAKTGGNVILTIDSNSDWEYEIPTSAGWLTKTAETATSLTLAAANNAKWGGRSAVVTVKLTSYSEYTYSYTVYQAGAADMLDVIFNTDGTATDVSPMAHTVEWRKTNEYPLSVAYNSSWGRNVVTFNPKGNAETPGDYYVVNYDANTDFQNKLADGHSFECVVKFDVDYITSPPAAGVETKFFSTHGAGGTGFLIAAGNHASGANGITFLPNIPVADGGASNWIWANSTTKPDGEAYYHLVGVWNQTLGKAYLYMNGALAKEVDAAGFYRPIQVSPKALVIGGDAGGNLGLESPYKGSMVIARMYDSPLTAADATALYNEITTP